jgi:hypothetical protein
VITQGKTLHLKWKSVNFDVHTRSKSVNSFIDSKEDIMIIANQLLDDALPLDIRLMGLRMSHLRTKKETNRGLQKYFVRKNFYDDEDDIEIVEMSIDGDASSEVVDRSEDYETENDLSMENIDENKKEEDDEVVFVRNEKKKGMLKYVFKRKRKLI